MEIEEKVLDKERLASRGVLIKNYWMDLHVVNCRPKVPECDSTMSAIAHMTFVAVNEKFIGLKPCGCNWVFIEMIHWLSIMATSLFIYNCWRYDDCWDVFMLSVNGVSTIFRLTHFAIEGLHRHTLTKLKYWSSQ